MFDNCKKWLLTDNDIARLRRETRYHSIVIEIEIYSQFSNPSGEVIGGRHALTGSIIITRHG